MSRRTAWLLVRSGGRLVGLELPRVVEVLATGRVHPVPSREPAVRGITEVRGRILPVVSLGVLLDGVAPPSPPGEALVVVELGGGRLCLEVEWAEEVLLGAGLPVPHATTLPWASAVARHEEQLVPLLDLDALGARLGEAASA